MKRIGTALRAAGLAGLLCIFGMPALASDTALSAAVRADYAYLEPLFIHFHENPELSYVEHETAARIAEELRAAGVEVTEGVGGTGVVGVLKNGDGPTVLIRADMDGLPVEEKSGLPYASTKRQKNFKGVEMPVMHACGHDVHITALIGAARRLADLKDSWRGTVLFIAQPAEERLGGARAMMDDGLYERFGRPDVALAFHVSSLLEAGKVMVEPGLAYSSSDSVDIIVHGVGAHGASPHLGKDPIVIGAQIVLALQTLVSREIPPLQPGVVTVGAFNAGLKHNIISDRAELQLTVRSNDESVRETLLAGIKRIAENTGRAAGLPDDKLPEVILSTESTPVTLNDPKATARARAAIVAQLGEDMMTFRARTGMGAEDFAYFVQTEPPVPGVYFGVGGTPADELATAPSHHSPLFKITPEPAILSGVEAMTAATLEFLDTAE